MILVAPNAFKGALSAEEAAKAISHGLGRAGITAGIVALPIADGGDGSLPLIAGYLKMKLLEEVVSGPSGRPVRARWGWKEEDKIAVIELAEASGIRYMKQHELAPVAATTYGTGQLLRHAIAKGARDVYLAVGGSATVDGGVGILEALGGKFYTAMGELTGELTGEQLLKGFTEVVSMDMTSARKQLGGARVRVLCDVNNPLLGQNGAAVVFGPQKGADEETVKLLEGRLAHWSRLILQHCGKAVGRIRHGGAAGGVAAGLYGTLDTELINGAEQILKWAELDRWLEKADLVITGEGRIDRQTNYGKGPGLVAKRARAKGIKVIGLSGTLDADTREVACFDELIRISDPEDGLATSMKKTAENLEKAGERIGKKQLSAG